MHALGISLRVLSRPQLHPPQVGAHEKHGVDLSLWTTVLVACVPSKLLSAFQIAPIPSIEAAIRSAGERGGEAEDRQ